ncbi:MAG: hypothetical protein JW829_03295 [Pirellulales bacterium]|nr:hypothetical protein [Pirellulales bacterium]
MCFNQVGTDDNRHRYPLADRGAFVGDDDLITAFVESLEFDQWFTQEDPPPIELNAGIDPDDWNCVCWKPARIETPRKAIIDNYCLSGIALPPLYERFVLTYRWLEVRTEKIRLFSNSPGVSLDPLAKQIFQDPVFDRHLFCRGCIPFGLDINVRRTREEDDSRGGAEAQRMTENGIGTLVIEAAIAIHRELGP